MALAGGCHQAGPPPVPPDEALLSRQAEGLQTLITAAEKGSLVPFGRVLVVVDQQLVQDLLRSAIPWERVISERYRVKVTGAEVSFDDGFAMVRLDGRVSLVASMDTDVFAELQVFGGIDVVELDPSSGMLRAKVSLIAFDVRRVGIFGESTLGKELVEDLARQRLEAFAVLASSFDIPVSLEREMQIPAVGPAGPVSIPAATVALRIGVSDVKAFRGKLWISVDAEARESARPSPANRAHGQR